MAETRPAAGRVPGRGLRFPLGSAVLALASLLLLSCELISYEVRDWLFDGVPPPDGEVTEAPPEEAVGAAEEAPEVQGRPPPGPVSKHKPWAEQKCQACHDVFGGAGNAEQFMARDKGAALCYSCHLGFLEKRTYAHGPVAVGACLFCHLPHYSQEKALLVAAPTDVCHRCHEPAMLLETPAHKESAERACDECHDPHGGSNRFFLRDGTR